MTKTRFEQELLDLHKETLDAHLNKDVDFFVKNIADDYFSISRGEIRNPTKEAIITQFTNYLGSTEFSEYRDLIEPIIKVSDDGTLGWTIVNVKIVADREIEGTVYHIEDVWVWITCYMRENDIWIRMGEVSCVKPQEE